MSELVRKPYTFDQFTAIRRYSYGTITFSPDGSQVAYTVNTSGHFNLWRQSSGGGFPHQLTTYHERAVAVIAWSPDGNWIAYSADYEGDEFYQLFAIPSDGGVPIQLTDAEKVWHEFSTNSWSPNGRYLGYNANDRNPAAMDILIRDLETGEAKTVLQGDEYYVFGNWAPDDRQILAMETRTDTDMDLHIVDTHSGESQLLTPHEGEAKFVPGPWAPDASGFYMLTDEGREFMGLAFFDLGLEKWEWIEKPDWDIQAIDGSRDGRYLAWTVNEHGYSRLHIRDLKRQRLISVPEIPHGVIWTVKFSPDGGKLGLMLITPTHCAEIFILDLSKGKLAQITHSMLGGIDERDLVTPELVSYKTFDDRNIPAWLYKPRDASMTSHTPIILSIHGGPEWQEFPIYAYSGLYQYWSSLGIGVLAPNIRGSTGYGKSYQKLIHRDWGGGELKDIEAAAHYLRSLDWVDKDNLGLFGASFGGFATLSAASRLPEYWAAAVDIVGPSNLVTLIETGPPHWRKMDERAIGDPKKDFDSLMSRSPITYADQIKAPLFIIQGANDPRVPKAESDQIVDFLRERGVEVRYDVYEDEGHGFTKRENEIKAWKDASGFLESHLLA